MNATMPPRHVTSSASPSCFAITIAKIEPTGGKFVRQLLEHEDELHGAEADAPELLGDDEAGPVEPHVGLPQGGVVALPVGDRSHERRRALLGGDLAHDALQLHLVVGQLEVHAVPSHARVGGDRRRGLTHLSDQTEAGGNIVLA